MLTNAKHAKQLQMGSHCGAGQGRNLATIETQGAPAKPRGILTTTQGPGNLGIPKIRKDFLFIGQPIRLMR